MPALSMPEARLQPAVWVAEISKAVEMASVNADIKKRWFALKNAAVKDGAWHKAVKEKVVIPYNVMHGGWATPTPVGRNSYAGLTRAQAKGCPDFVIGNVMPGGFRDIAASLSPNTRNLFKSIWQLGDSTGRGETTFGAGATAVSLDHKTIGGGHSSERLWYINTSPYTLYAVTDHVDSTAPGKKALADLTNDVEGWIEAGDVPVLAGFLNLDTTCSQLYVIT